MPVAQAAGAKAVRDLMAGTATTTGPVATAEPTEPTTTPTDQRAAQGSEHGPVEAAALALRTVRQRVLVEAQAQATATRAKATTVMPPRPTPVLVAAAA